MIVRISKNVIVEADIKKDDESFDHEHGTEKRTTVTLENFKVTFFVDGIDYEITKGLKPKELEYFKSELRGILFERDEATIGEITCENL